jgi:hypothetical protein
MAQAPKSFSSEPEAFFNELKRIHGAYQQERDGEVDG